MMMITRNDYDDFGECHGDSDNDSDGDDDCFG